MRFFKGFLIALFLVSCFVYCTKNSVEGGISPTSVQLFNYYYSTSKTFSLVQGKDTVLSNIGFNVASPIASGAPGFYSLLFWDNAKDSAILSGNINLQAGTRYSMFVVQDSAQNSDAVNYSLVTNSTTDPLPLYDSCRVRILNFARGIDLLTLRFTINAGVGYGLLSPFFKTTTSQGRSYLDNNVYPEKAQYFTVPAGTTGTTISYQLRILNFSNGADTSKAIDSTLITFQKQKLYTLCLLGRYDSTSSANHHYTYPDSLRLQIITE